MIHYIGDSAKKIERTTYYENGILKVRDSFELLGAVSIVERTGNDVDYTNIVSFISSNDGNIYSISENESINDWSIDNRLVKTEDFVILYDLDIAQRQQIPESNATTIAFLKHRNISLLKKKKIINKEKPELIPVVSMDDLRTNGVTVSKAISWERTATDFLRDLNYGVCKELLSKFPIFIVLLETDGMIIRQNDILKLYFAPSKAEGDSGSLSDEAKRGIICMQIVKQITTGGYDFSLVMENATGVHILPQLVELKDLESWSILNDVYGDDPLKLMEIAKKIVINGEKEIFGGVPYCQYGALQTVDRTEIENYRAILNLITSYSKSTDSGVLSISVFGLPGSGKLFGIKQIADALGGFEIFNFNLSMFTKLSDIETSFQEIRDVSIKGGMLPLVFFDKFDSAFNAEPLGWLKSFLAPMKDGIFMEDGRERQIGRAIFVFVGSTSTSFKSFINQDQELFKKMKGLEFTSHLKGYMDTRGINPVGVNDKFYVIRRAILLRSMICRSLKQLLDADGHVNIDENILYALLSTPIYKYGIRSLKFFISMSPLLGASKWTSSLLPPKSQMDIHVDAEEFISKILVLAMCKELARMTYEMYLEEELAKNPDKSFNATIHWEDLSETYQKRNISQVQFHLERFKDFNIAIRQSMLPNKDFIFTDEDLLKLSIREHERLCNELIADGWTYAEKRDDEKKFDDKLVNFEQLSEEDKQKNTDAIKKIPILFNKIGLELYYK